MDFTIIQKAGLTYKEAAHLLEVSTVTILNYYKGSKPRPRRIKRVATTLRVLEGLVQQGKLPRTQDSAKSNLYEVRQQRSKVVAKIKAHIDNVLTS